MQSRLILHVGLRCHSQSGRVHQLGFRLPGDRHVRAFGHGFTAPCSRYGWSSFSEWEAQLDALPPGARIDPYTREVVVHDGVRAVPCHLTIARGSRTSARARAQGWVTAHKDTPLYHFVAAHLGQTINARFVPRDGADLLLLPGVEWTTELAA